MSVQDLKSAAHAGGQVDLGRYVLCKTNAQASALLVLVQERAYQDTKWGTIQQRPREVGTYLTLMRKLLTDAERAYTESCGDSAALEELRKVVAVGLACFEQHGAPHRSEKPQPPIIPVGVACGYCRKFVQKSRCTGTCAMDSREVLTGDYCDKFEAAQK